MLCVRSGDFAQICSDVLSRVILPVLLSNVLRPLVAFDGFWTLFGIYYEGLSRYRVKLFILIDGNFPDRLTFS
jgi:hypothetical protein